MLASDRGDYYEPIETGRFFPTAFHVGAMVKDYDKRRARRVFSARHSRP